MEPSNNQYATPGTSCAERRVMGNSEIEITFRLLSLEAIRSSNEIEHVGIYFLFKANELIYIGQTENIKNRIDAHMRTGKRFDWVKMVPCAVEDLDVLEALYVKEFRPILNRGSGRVGRKRANA